jgi:DNA-binding CsgD family transcriptional regulator
MINGDLARARSLLDEAVAAATAADNQVQASAAINALAQLTAMEGDLEQALGLYRRALGSWLELGDTKALTKSLELFACLVSTTGAKKTAVRLLAASKRLRERLDRPRLEARHLVEPVVADLRQRLPAQDFEAAWSEGLTMSPAEAVRTVTKSHGTTQRPDKGWPSLTDSEREVVRLVAEGHTNKEVGQRLMISPNTARRHLNHVFNKLGVSSRTELAQWSRHRT